GIPTILKTTDEIYAAYDGRDEPEKIKYAIKDAIEEYGIKYVLLAGGMEGQHVHKWYVPVRYSYLDDGVKTGYMSDLYYADVYKYDNGSLVFENWDSNGNGVYAEWSKSNKDVLDMYPDVYVGRLAFRWKWEIKGVIDKIIGYENNARNQEWFKRMVVIGGDSFPDKDLGTDYIEGQEECDKALSYMDNFSHVRIYVEGGDVNFTPENAEIELSKGEGFVYFSGHGSPASWGTHPHNHFHKWIDFDLKNIRKLNNGEKLPVLIVGGCLNCRFDTSILRIFTDGIWTYFSEYAIPECWGWLFTRNPNGGSIATMGNTDLGYGAIGDGNSDEIPDGTPDGIPDCIQYFDGWLEPHFFEVYNKHGKDMLGEAWGTNLADYLNQFLIDWSKEWESGLPYNFHIVNCKTVQEWVLLGDPSLKIGGY
ncbi:MAG: peptidase C25, partial [Thermoplasmata archaeon]|nr:peptidase C25 [Thermoplasmata archaeon]